MGTRNDPHLKAKSVQLSQRCTPPKEIHRGDINAKTIPYPLTLASTGSFLRVTRDRRSSYLRRSTGLPQLVRAFSEGAAAFDVQQ